MDSQFLGLRFPNLRYLRGRSPRKYLKFGFLFIRLGSFPFSMQAIIISAGENTRMENETVHLKPGYWQAWLLASRPKTLPAAAAPVIIGIGLAVGEGVFRFGPALAALAVALLLQIGANVSNDYFDYQKGADTDQRLGPTRVTQAGLLPLRHVVAGMLVVFGLAGLIGIYLIVEAGWPAALIGGLAILSALAYTGGPYPLGYHGLGELFVFLFFGLAAVAGTYFVQALSFSPAALWLSLPAGLIADGILTVNNLRDLETDRISGKHTLAVRMGERGAVIEYWTWLVLAYLCVAGAVLTRAVTLWALLSWLSIPMAVSLARRVATIRGRKMNALLAQTGQLELVFALLLALGLVI